MPGPQHARMPRAELERTITAYAGATYPHDLRDHAVRAVLGFNDLQGSDDKLGEAGFENVVRAVASRLNVAMPDASAPYEGQSQPQLVDLANALELAEWDFRRRADALVYTETYWRDRGVSPTTTQYLDMFLRIANYMRAVRDLPAVT